MPSPTLAIDFGTSNTAVAIAEAGQVRRIPLEAGADTLPTAVFFPARGGTMRIGEAAAEALIAGEEGRYMRALKSILGTALAHEPRLLGGKRRSVAEVITAFLIRLRAAAEAETGNRFTRVLSGRPVHFHSADPERDAQAEADLRGCYLAAGFDEVRFLAEPEAAALASQSMGDRDTLGLIVDIGGGTSDFSVFQSAGADIDILANHGIRLGGTDFDHALSMAHVMPLLGHGGQLRREMGQGLLPVPRGIYVDLATWAKIPFLYSPETRRMVADMAKQAVDRAALARLATVLDEELGHDLAFAVERGKIAANNPGAAAQIPMGFIEPRLSAPLTEADLQTALSVQQTQLRQAALDTLTIAGVAPDAIGRVILVGGSSLMAFVGQAMTGLCPAAQLLRSHAFTAVVDGLALAAEDKTVSA